MPALGQVLFDVTEGAHAQLPPDVSRVLFFDHEHLSQSLNFIFHLCRRKPSRQKNREHVLINPINLPSVLLKYTVVKDLPNRCLTFDSSVCRWSKSSWVRSEAEHLLSVTPVDDEAPGKPATTDLKL